MSSHDAKPSRSSYRADRIEVTMNNFAAFKQKVDIAVETFGDAAEYWLTSTKPNLAIPDEIWDQLEGETDSAFNLRRARRESERKAQKSLRNSATSLTCYLAACPDAELLAQMLVDKPRFDLALRNHDFVDMLSLIKEKSERKSSSRMINLFQDLLRTQNDSPFNGSWVLWTRLFEENWDEWSSVADMAKLKAILYMNGLCPEAFKPIIEDWARSNETQTFEKVREEAAKWYLNRKKDSETHDPAKSARGSRPDIVKARNSHPKLTPSSAQNKRPKRSKFAEAKIGEVCEHPSCRDFKSKHTRPNHFFPKAKCTVCGRDGHYDNQCKSTGKPSHKKQTVATSNNVTAHAESAVNLAISTSHTEDEANECSFDIRKFIKLSANTVKVLMAGSILVPIEDDPNEVDLRAAHPAGFPAYSTLNENNSHSPIHYKSSSSSSVSPLLFACPQEDDDYEDNTSFFTKHDTEAQISTVFVNHARMLTNNPPVAHWNDILIFDSGCLSMHVANSKHQYMIGSHRLVAGAQIEGYRDGELYDAEGVGNLPYLGKAILDSHARTGLISTRTMHKDLKSFAIEDSSSDSYTVWIENPITKECKFVLQAFYQEGVGYAIKLGELVHLSNSVINASSRERAHIVSNVMANNARSGEAKYNVSVESLLANDYAMNCEDSDGELVEDYSELPSSPTVLKQHHLSPTAGPYQDHRANDHYIGTPPRKTFDADLPANKFYSPEPPIFSPTDPMLRIDQALQNFGSHRRNISFICGDIAPLPDTQSDDSDPDESPPRKIMASAKTTRVILDSGSSYPFTRTGMASARMIRTIMRGSRIDRTDESDTDDDDSVPGLISGSDSDSSIGSVPDLISDSDESEDSTDSELDNPSDSADGYFEDDPRLPPASSLIITVTEQDDEETPEPYLPDPNPVISREYVDLTEPIPAITHIIVSANMMRVTEPHSTEHFTPNQRIRSQKVWELHCTIGNHMTDVLFGTMLDASMWPQHQFTSSDLRIARKLYGPCIACDQGKSKADPKLESQRPPPTSIGQRVCMDIVEFRETTAGSNNWSLISMDSLTGWGCSVSTPTKKSAALKEALGSIIATYNRYLHKVVEVTSDPEQCILATEQFLNSQGISLDPTIPGRHMTEIERYIQRVKRMKHTLLCDMTFEPPASLDGELEAYVIDLLNDTPNKKTYPRTPNQLVTQRNPTARPYRWGSVGLFHSYKDKYEHSEFGFIVGMNHGRKHQFRVYFPLVKRILSRSAPTQVFDDALPEWSYKARNSPKQRILAAQKAIRSGEPPNINNDIQTTIISSEPTANPTSTKSSATDQLLAMDPTNAYLSDDSSSNDSAVTISESEDRQRRAAKVTLGLSRSAADEDRTGIKPIASESTQPSSPILDHELEAPNPPTVIKLVESKQSKKAASKEARRSAQLLRLTKQLNQDLVKLEIEGPRSRRMDYAALVNKGHSKFDQKLSLIGAIVNRISLKSALKSEAQDMARESIKKEITSLLNEHKALINVAYEDIPQDLRNKCVLIHCFLKDKISPEGEFIKLKSRIVAGGNTQDSTTYNDTTAPTINSVSLMLILHIMAAEDRECATFDVPSAFVRVPADPGEPPIYGFMDPTLSKLVCELNPELESKLHRGMLYFQIVKYLYGLKQASRKFYEFMKRFFVSEGFEMCTQDHCLFVKRVGSDNIVAAIHVDDILVTAPSKQLLDQFRLRLVEEFQVEQHLDSPFSFLGMTVTRDRDARTVKITMKSSIEKLIAKYAPDLPPKETPSTQDLFRTSFPESEALSPSEQATFASLNMAIMYIARYCRFDTLLAPTVLASRLKKACKSDLKELVRILQYYKSTPNVGPTLGGKDLGPVTLIGLSDASHAIIDGRGMGALALTLGSAPVATRCWILKVGTLSSTESEILATTEVTTYVIWARPVLEFMGYPQPKPTVILQDNQASIIMHNQRSGSFKRAKHILARIAFNADQVRDGICIYVKIDTKDMMVDMLTKVHSRVPLQRNLEAAYLTR